MEETPERNCEFESPDIFSLFNNYLLLFFGASCILSYIFIQQLLLTMGQLRLGILAAPILGIILPIYFVTRRFPGGVKKQLLIRKPRVPMVLYVSLATLVVVVIVDHIYMLSLRFLPPPNDYIEGLKELKPSGVPAIVATFLGLCIAAPIAEEVIFRGVIQRIFSRNMAGVFAIMLAGLFFGIMHFTPHLLPTMFAFGVFVGYLFFATSNLVYPILAHCAFNTVAFVQLVFANEADIVFTSVYDHTYWVLGGSVAIFFYLMTKIRKGGSVETDPPHNHSGNSMSN